MRNAGLKNLILNQLEKEGYLSLDYIHAIAHAYGAKESQVERKLRKDKFNPDPRLEYIKPIKNEKGHITGYQWVEQEKVFNYEPISLTNHFANEDIYSSATLKILKQKELEKLTPKLF